MTYRMGAHTTSDDPTRYRQQGELEIWSKKDPITRFRTWLEDQDMLDEAASAAIDREAESAAEAMRSKIRSITPAPPGDAIFGRVYTRPSESFQEEREEFESTLEGG
jgi:pyruvate dehydrogenase E1 component alpha subunit